MILGHGCSSKPVTERTIDRLRTLVPGLFVIGMNRGWGPWPLDLLVTVDHDQAWEFLRLRRFEQCPIAFPQRMLQQWMMGQRGLPEGLEAGVNWYSIAPLPGGTSSGGAAFQVALICGAPVVCLIGFDGSRDPTSRFHGSYGYRLRTPDAAGCAGWEEHMVKMANYERDTSGRTFDVLLGLPDEDPHPLDALPARRVVVAGAHPEEEIARCLLSAQARSC